MLRTTVYLPEVLVEAAKLEALKRKVPFTRLVEAGLKKELQVKVVVKKGKLTLGKYKLGGFRFNREHLYEDVLKHRVRGY